MGYISFTLIVQILLLSFCDSDVMLNKVIINKESPKVWNRYITKSIHRYLNKGRFYIMKINYLFLQMFKYSRSLVKLKDTLMTLEVCYFQSVKEYIHVKIASGTFLSFAPYLNDDICQKLHFILHPSLRLNFTFHSISTAKGSKLEVSNLTSDTVSFSYTGQHCFLSVSSIQKYPSCCKNTKEIRISICN